MIKLVFVLSAIFVIQAKGGEVPMKRTLETLSKKCVGEVNAPADSFKLLGGKTVPTEEKQQCYLECIYRGLKLINDVTLDSGVAKTLAANRYKTKQDLDNAYKVIDSCSTIKAENGLKCGLGVAVRRCILDYGLKNNFYLQP